MNADDEIVAEQLVADAGIEGFKESLARRRASPADVNSATGCLGDSAEAERDRFAARAYWSNGSSTLGCVMTFVRYREDQ